MTNLIQHVIPHFPLARKLYFLCKYSSAVKREMDPFPLASIFCRVVITAMKP